MKKFIIEKAKVDPEMDTVQSGSSSSSGQQSSLYLQFSSFPQQISLITGKFHFKNLSYKYCLQFLQFSTKKVVK